VGTTLTLAAMTSPVLRLTPQLAPKTSENPSVLAWAIYVGMSWTWCIGMFLPIILLRDFGLWSFAFFAIPNVLGAAAMAWIFNPQTSAAFVARHRAACSVFSIVTIAFNLFFVLTVTNSAAMDSVRQLPHFVLLVVLALTMALPRRAPLVAMIVLAISLGMLIWAAASGDARSPLDIGTATTNWQPQTLAIAPVLVLGFLTCPWFDLTFHHAVVNAGPRGKPVFALGFGVFFLAMIVFTLFYAVQFIDAAASGSSAIKTFLPLASLPIAIHLAAQVGFTAASHIRPAASPTIAATVLAKKNEFNSPSVQTTNRGAIICMLCTVLALAAAGVAIYAPPLDRLTAFETVYMTFLSFYGLVIPAYALNCAIPTPDATSGPSRTKLIITAVAILAASPFFVQGFLLGHYNALILGVGVLFASRALTTILHRRVTAATATP